MLKLILSVMFVNFVSVPHCTVDYEYMNDDTFLKPNWISSSYDVCLSLNVRYT